MVLFYCISTFPIYASIERSAAALCASNGCLVSLLNAIINDKSMGRGAKFASQLILAVCGAWILDSLSHGHSCFTDYVSDAAVQAGTMRFLIEVFKLSFEQEDDDRALTVGFCFQILGKLGARGRSTFPTLLFCCFKVGLFPRWRQCCWAHREHNSSHAAHGVPRPQVPQWRLQCVPYDGSKFGYTTCPHSCTAAQLHNCTAAQPHI
jgi:hypothetical protein